ncbi:MAG: AtpZ/AtpI family protein [Bacteroidales bacterium]
MSTQEKQSSKKKNKKALSNYARYSAIAFQMIAIIVIGMFGGMQLDKWITGIEFPVFTVVLSISGVVFATYYAIKDFIKPGK